MWLAYLKGREFLDNWRVQFRRGRVRGIFPVGEELPTLRSALLHRVLHFSWENSWQVSVIFEREEEGEGVGNRDRFLAGCWWACVIAD